MLHCYRCTLLTVWPVERQGLAVGGEPAAGSPLVDATEIALTARREPADAILDEVELPGDITRPKVGNLRDLRQGVAVHEELENLAVLRLPAMFSRR